jgi:hypothetical protein
LAVILFAPALWIEIFEKSNFFSFLLFVLLWAFWFSDYGGLKKDVAAEQYQILNEYLSRQVHSDTVVKEVAHQFAKSFPDFTREDYFSFMSELDLSNDDDLWKWSHVTGIPILAVNKSSNFFYANRHLIMNMEEAERLERTDIKTSYDKSPGELQVRTTEGRELAIRELPRGTIRLTERTSGYSHIKNYGEDRIYFEALESYLVLLRDLQYRDEIGKWIRTLPLSVVKIYRGKGIYFTTQTGRSYSVAMPVSNSTYTVFVGLQTGVFIDPRSDGPTGTARNFVHELGHLVDYNVIKGGYGRYRQAHQFPEFRKTQPEKELIYGEGDDKVPQTPYGYISSYARVNAQESFAVHFRAYIMEKETFLDQARKEESEGHSELMEKFRFMEHLLDETSSEMIRLSSEYLALEKAWQDAYPQISSLYQKRKDLGDKATGSLTQMIDKNLAAAYTDKALH